MPPTPNTSAPSSSARSTARLPKAAACWATAWSLAEASAASATASSVASRSTDSLDQALALMSGACPATSAFRCLSRASVYSALKKPSLASFMAVATEAGSCVPKAMYSSALQAACAPPRAAAYFRGASSATLPAAMPFETISEASPPALRAIQAASRIASIWLMKGSVCLTAAPRRADTLSRMSITAVAWFLYSSASPSRRSALGRWMASHDFGLQPGQGFDRALEVWIQRLPVLERHVLERREGRPQGRHFLVANALQPLFDVGCDQLGIVQAADGGGSVGAQVVHRLEGEARRVRDHRDPAGDRQPLPGIPGAEPQHDDDKGGHDGNDRLQQGACGQTAKHKIRPPGSLPLVS